jgi:hypothetical protein
LGHVRVYGGISTAVGTFSGATSLSGAGVVSSSADYRVSARSMAVASALRSIGGVLFRLVFTRGLPHGVKEEIRRSCIEAIEEQQYVYLLAFLYTGKCRYWLVRPNRAREGRHEASGDLDKVILTR